MFTKNRSPIDIFLKLITYISVIITTLILFFVVGYILVTGVPHLSLSLFSFENTTENISALPGIITTLYVIVIALSISLPLGIFTAIYLVEYANISNWYVKVIRVTTETLAGIPSIVYGLFGMLFFVTYLRWGFSLLAGSFTIGIMILPLIIRTTEEGLMSVPNGFREASFGLGAGKLDTIFKIVLPSASKSILGGIILAIGRIVGESAALVFTAGTIVQIPKSIFSSGSTLSVQMYILSGEALHMDEARAIAVILLLVVVIINLITNKLVKREGR